MARTRYDDATKAAVLAALLEGQGTTEVAQRYQVPEGTIKSWRARMKGESIATVAPGKKEHIGELLIEYLHTNLETLRAQSAIFADPEWLRKQEAQQVAVLHGVITDKTIRLLEALGGAGERAS